MLEITPDSAMILESLMQLKFYHALFSLCFVLPILLNLYNLFFHKNLVAMNKRIWFVMPLVFFLLSVAFLSGLNLVFFNFNGISFGFVLMCVFWLLALIGEIRRVKMLKVARRTSLEAMQQYIKFAKGLYGVELVLFVVIVCVYYV